MRIAIIGSGVAGTVSAHLLHQRHDVVLYEADDRAGGHTHTHRIELPDTTAQVDTGFLVYNERTYPLFCRLLERLGVASEASDMSFSVSGRPDRPRMAGELPLHRFRPAGQPGPAGFLADAGRHRRSTIWPGVCSKNHHPMT